eukprot:TRINITY_DN35111_c0_g1_i1.p1 TRINITY_DN35111_c0_g1~~TRINITY_DN35111_c0_g1_i1.p1  ORF type:complete len:815 (-),score=145.09 TRINITY_DN35111_c0_g1_i1:62-2476(-)
MAPRIMKSTSIRPEFATVSDVRSLGLRIDGVKQEIGEHTYSLEGKLQAIRNDVDNRVDELSSRVSAAERRLAADSDIRGVVERHAERLEVFRRAQMYIDGRLESWQRDAKTKFDALEEELKPIGPRIAEGLVAVRGEFASSIAAANSRIDERTVACANNAVSISEVRSELNNAKALLLEQFKRDLETSESRTMVTCDGRLTTQVLRLDADIASAAQRQRAALDALTSTLREEASAGDEAVRDAASVAVAAAEARQKALVAEQCDIWDESVSRLDSEIQVCRAELARFQEALRRSDAEAQKARCEAERQLEAVQADSQQRLGHLESVVCRLEAVCSEVSGIPTRQVEWQIEGGLRTFRTLQLENGANPASLFSPKFDAAGISGFQLELRSLGAVEQDAERHGDCSLYLWGREGVQLAFRLSMGSESAVLRHTFDGKTPCGVHCMATLAEQAEQSTLSVKASVEIHEANFEVKTEHGSCFLGSQPTQSISCFTGSDQHHCESPCGYDLAEHSPIGTLVSKRSTNNQMLEMIQTQSRGLSEYVLKKVDIMRSKAVRRVQWRLDHSSKLRSAFAEGVPVCSTAFQAAGINGLQLVFYPSGSAGAKEGFCSFFLSYPPGCSLRCWLWAGRWRKEARPEATDQTNLLGRVNFCRFENCVDPVDETVELALEIEDAQVPKAQLAGVAGPTNLGTLPDLNPGSTTLSPSTERVDSCVARVRASRSQIADVAVKQLPSIWTTQKFKNFTDIGGRAHGPVAGAAFAAAGAGGVASEERKAGQSSSLPTTARMSPRPPCSPKKIARPRSEGVHGR